jgi:rhodanese-related sulfurtransferase
MKPTVTVSWKTMGFVAMIAVGALLAIMPSRLAGASLEARLAEVATSMPSAGFSVDPRTLAGWLSTGKPVTLVDVREHWEFDEFHIEGAVRAPIEQLVAPEGIKALPPDLPVVVLGRGDTAAAQAAAMLRLAGCEAYALEGGLAAWWREVLMPASIDPTIPAADKPTVAAQRVAWRARFLGAAAAGSAETPGAPAATTSMPATVPMKAPAKKGKGC